MNIKTLSYETRLDIALILSIIPHLFLLKFPMLVLKLSYSIRPKPLDLNHSIDSFLFDKKEGYCVHFASSFALSARMAGIPSRIVTGFKASKKNMVKNYLIIKELDAHAWVELYIKNNGWVRFEPTSSAYRILSSVDNIDGSTTSNSIFKTINMQFMYMKYLINNWILEKAKPRDEALNAMLPLLKRLKKLGVIKESYQTMEDLLQNAKTLINKDKIENISYLYHRVKYSSKSDKLKELKEAIVEILK